MTKEGIFNPFAPPPKKPPKSQQTGWAWDKITLAEELGLSEGAGTSFRLDGGSYILQLDDIEFEKIPERLGTIVKEINEKFSDEMEQQGIRLIPKNKEFVVNENEMILPTPVGHLIIYVGSSPDNEDGAYRRLAHALLNVPSKTVLAKYKAKIIVRS